MTAIQQEVWNMIGCIMSIPNVNDLQPIWVILHSFEYCYIKMSQYNSLSACVCMCVCVASSYQSQYSRFLSHLASFCTNLLSVCYAMPATQLDCVNPITRTQTHTAAYTFVSALSKCY